MPITNLSWRNTCGVFFWTFSNFMEKRARLASGRCQPIFLLWPMNFTRTVVLSLLFILVCVSTDSGTTTDCCCHVHATCAFQKFTSNFTGGKISFSRLYGTFLMLAVMRYSRTVQRGFVVPLGIFLVAKHDKSSRMMSVYVYVFMIMFLLMCGDVESNPGPGFPSDPSDPAPAYPPIEQYLQQLCDSQSAVQNSVCSLDALCRSLKEENRQLKEEVSCLSDKCSVFEHHFSQLFQWQEYLLEMSEHLHDHQDKLETFSRQYNIRFFNVQEDLREDYKTCARKVVQLLTRFYPFKTWSLDDVERAHRIGPRNQDGRPRTIIARLRNWSDKLSVLQEGECRRDMADTLGIRVAGDLTIRQQGELRRQRLQGKTSYFRNGRLCFREQRSPRYRTAKGRGDQFDSQRQSEVVHRAQQGHCRVNGEVPVSSASIHPRRVSSPDTNSSSVPRFISSSTCTPPPSSSNHRPPPSTSNCPPLSSTLNCPPLPSTSNRPPPPSTSNCPPLSSTSNCPPLSSTSNCPPPPSTSNCPPPPSTSNCPPLSSTSNRPPLSSASNRPPLSSTPNRPPLSSTPNRPPPFISNCPPPPSTSTHPPPSSTSSHPPLLSTSNGLPPPSTSSCLPLPSTYTRPLPPPTSIHPPPSYNMQEFPTMQRTSTPRSNRPSLTCPDQSRSRSSHSEAHTSCHGGSPDPPSCRDVMETSSPATVNDWNNVHQAGVPVSTSEEHQKSTSTQADALDDGLTLVKQKMSTLNPPVDVENQSMDLMGTEQEDKMEKSAAVMEKPQSSPWQVSLVNETKGRSSCSGPRTRSKARTRQLQLTESFSRAHPRNSPGRACRQKDDLSVLPHPPGIVDT